MNKNSTDPHQEHTVPQDHFEPRANIPSGAQNEHQKTNNPTNQMGSEPNSQLNAILASVTAGYKRIAIVGLAKNAGKTTVLNTLINWVAKQDIKLGLASIGRDGEDTDLITLEKKPRIHVPPGCFCVTTNKIANPIQGLALEEALGEPGVLGIPGIYHAEQKCQVELVGINMVSAMSFALERLSCLCDLVLVDGALDRRSFALPSLVDGVILATGGTVGNTVDLVVQRTLAQIRLLSLPQCSTGNTIIPGAFTDRMAYELLRSSVATEATSDSTGVSAVDDQPSPPTTTHIIQVKDWTRIFLSPGVFDLLHSRGFSLCVAKQIQLAGITTNPYNPSGAWLDPLDLNNAMNQALANSGISVPCFDVVRKILL